MADSGISELASPQAITEIGANGANIVTDAKYGLQVAGESLSHADMQRKAKQAEKDVLNQFKGSNTVSFNSPLLAIWDQSLRTSEEEFDPVFELNRHLQTDLSEEHRLWLQLEASAILDVFHSSLKSAAEIKKANLAEKNVRFLDLLRTLVHSREKLSSEPLPP